MNIGRNLNKYDMDTMLESAIWSSKVVDVWSNILKPDVGFRAAARWILSGSKRVRLFPSMEIPRGVYLSATGKYRGPLH